MQPTVRLEDIFEDIIEKLYCGYEIADVVLTEHLVLDIYLHGKSWDGKLDYRVGDFLLKLQKDIFSIYNSVTGNNVNFKSKQELISSLTVKVDAQKKCLNLKVFLDAIKAAFPYMNGNQIATVLIVFILTGGFLYAKYLNGREKISLAQLQSDAEKELARIESQTHMQEIIANSNKEIAAEVRGIVTDAVTISTQAQTHKAVLSRHMTPDDTLEINGQQYSQKQLKQAFINFDDTPESTQETHIIDDRYSIEDLSFKKRTVTLHVSNISHVASTRLLDEESKLALHKVYKKAELENTLPVVDLRVNAAIKGEKILEIAIIGVDAKRAGAKKLSEILTEISHKKALQNKITQHKLLN